MIILIDNYDSFTFNVYHYFSEIGAEVKVFRNDKISYEEVIKIDPKALILSPGPCTPNEAGICLDLVKKCKSLFPILGICLGHQSIGQAFGGKIIQCKEIIFTLRKDMEYSNFGEQINQNYSEEDRKKYHLDVPIEELSLLPNGTSGCTPEGLLKKTIGMSRKDLMNS